MAFELTYFYHEKKPEGGGYNTEEKKELKKKIGNNFEEIPLEQVATAIIKQLARRDIWVVDVEVNEYTKKPVSFKESNDGSGIVLKGKKFSLDHSASLVAVDVSVDLEEASQVPSSGMNLVAAAQKKQSSKPGGVNLVEPPVNPNRVMFWATFEPHPFTQEARSKGLKFSVGKKYPVHRQKDGPAGQTLYITDDAKKIVQVDEKYFSVAGAGLVGDDEVEGGFQQQDHGEPEPKLAYWSHMKGDSGGNGVPQLRGKSLKNIPDQYKDIPLDDGSIPDSYFNVPDIRKKR
jgi:hypothetical protein